MSLKQNGTNHWELPNGAELYSGELIEIRLHGRWVPGRIDYRPRRDYILVTDDGRELAITEDLEVRLRVFPVPL